MYLINFAAKIIKKIQLRNKNTPKNKRASQNTQISKFHKSNSPYHLW